MVLSQIYVNKKIKEIYYTFIKFFRKNVSLIEKWNIFWNISEIFRLTSSWGIWPLSPKQNAEIPGKYLSISSFHSSKIGDRKYNKKFLWFRFIEYCIIDNQTLIKGDVWVNACTESNWCRCRCIGWINDFTVVIFCRLNWSREPFVK